MGPKFGFPKNAFPTSSFSHKTCFTTFHIDLSQKIDKYILDPIFEKNLQVFYPPFFRAKINFFSKIIPPRCNMTEKIALQKMSQKCPH